jgi:hypothetical protein
MLQLPCCGILLTHSSPLRARTDHRRNTQPCLSWIVMTLLLLCHFKARIAAIGDTRGREGARYLPGVVQAFSDRWLLSTESGVPGRSNLRRNATSP